ncbi:MAG: CvpA family protein [Gammaproteobacteria bacterium]
MQTVDIVILVIFVLPGLIGILYGFLNIIFSIIAWVLALGISVKSSPFFSPMLAGHIETALIRDVLAFIGIFIISLMILTTLGYFIVKLLGRTGLTAADRILGFFLGIGLGGGIIAVIVFLAGFTAVPEQPWWQASVLIQPFQHIAVWGEKFLPENMSKFHGYNQAKPVTKNRETG